MTAPPMSARPGVDPRAIRPKRYWYLVAGAIAVVALLVPLAVYVAGQLTGPRLTELHAPGITRMTMKTSEAKWLYVSRPKRLIPPPCRLSGPGDVKLEPLTRFPSVDHDGAKWYAIAKIEVTRDGGYTLLCVGPSAGIRLAVGGDPHAPGVVGGLVADVLVPVLGVLLALALAVVTFVRRRSHRAGMLAAGGHGGAWGPPGYGTRPGYPAPVQPPAYDYPPPYETPPAGSYPPPGRYPQPGGQPPWHGPPQGR